MAELSLQPLDAETNKEIKNHQEIVSQLLKVFHIEENTAETIDVINVLDHLPDKEPEDKEAFINVLSEYSKYIDAIAGVKYAPSTRKESIDGKIEDIGFINEIIQNADDCIYAEDENVTPEFNISFEENAIVIQYNEIGMTWLDIKALTSYGYSNKNTVSNEDTFDKNTIGEKGIGFKFVFKACDTVEIFSNGYRFTLNGENLGTVPEWIEPSDKNADYRGYGGTTIILRNIKADAPALFNGLKEKYSANLCANPVLFTKKLCSITAKCNGDKITCERSGDIGMQSETAQNINAETKTVTISLECGDKNNDYSYDLFGISCPVKISREAIRARYQHQNKKNDYKNAYRCIFIFAAFDEAGSLQTDMNKIGGTMYSYLPTAEQLTVPLIVQLPVRLDQARMSIYFEGNNSLPWNDDVLKADALGKALSTFFIAMHDKLIKEGKYRKIENLEQVWKLLPIKGKLFKDENITITYDAVYEYASCFYSLSGDLISKYEAYMLDQVLKEGKLEEPYRKCIGKTNIISYDENKKGIINLFGTPDDSDKKKILKMLIDKDCQEKLFKIWNAGKPSVYLPELDSWKEQPIFPAAVDDGTVAYKPLTDGIWYPDKKLTAPENCFLHFYRCGDENDKMKESVNCVHWNAGDKIAVLKDLADMVGKPPRFSPTYEQLKQLALWGFDVDDPLKVWNDDQGASKADGSDKSNTESIKDTPKQSNFARIAAWCSRDDNDYIRALILMARAYCHGGFEKDSREIRLPPFEKWTPELREALNDLPFAVPGDIKKTFVVDSRSKRITEKLQKDIIDYYELDQNIMFYFYKPDGNEPIKEQKFVGFLNTVVFFEEVNNPDDEIVKAFIAKKLGSKEQIPAILESTNPIEITHTEKEKNLLNAIVEIIKHDCQYMTHGAKPAIQVDNDPINELLQNIDDSKLRSIDWLKKFPAGEIDPNSLLIEETNDSIVLRYTEKGFSVRDFYCITYRHSTGNINQGDSIGHFGTGFRSVYNMFKKVVIRSGGYCWTLEPYDDNSDSSKKRYEEYTAKGTNEMKEWRKHFLQLQPIPGLKEDTNPQNNITTITLYPKGDNVKEFKNPERYVFLDRLGSSDKDSSDGNPYIFTSYTGEKYLTYERKLDLDIKQYPLLRRTPDPIVTVRFGKNKPHDITPYYCGLPLTNARSRFFCYVNIPAIVPNEPRKDFSANDGIKCWNNKVMAEALSKIDDILKEYARYYYIDGHTDYLPPYEYLTIGPYWGYINVFPAVYKDKTIELFSICDINFDNKAWLLPEKFWNEDKKETFLTDLFDDQCPPDAANLLEKPLIKDEGVSRFLYKNSLNKRYIPPKVLFYILFPGKLLYDKMPDLGNDSTWLPVTREEVQEWIRKYSITSFDINSCVSARGVYENDDLCKRMFSNFDKFNDDEKRQLYKAAENEPGEDLIETVRANHWIPVLINNSVTLLKQDSYYVSVKYPIDSGYAVVCHDWQAGIPNILTKWDEFKTLFDTPSVNNDILIGCTYVFLKRRCNEPEVVDWEPEYAPILRTYCKEYSVTKNNRIEARSALEIQQNYTPKNGLLFTFNSPRKLDTDSLKWLESKFKACVDPDIVKWETLKTKCLIVPNKSYDGYAWQKVNEESKIVLFCRNDNKLPDILQKLIKDIFNVTVILGEKVLDEDDYMISKHNGDFSEEPDNIDNLIPYYLKSKENSPSASDNDLYLIGTWDFQRNGEWQRYKGYGTTYDELDRDILPSCPVCGGKLLAHRKSCKIEYVSAILKENADRENPFHIPVLMCSTCSSSMKYYYSVTLENSDTDGDVIDAISRNPGKLRICFNSLEGAHKLPFRPTVYHRLLMLDLMGRINHNPNQDDNSKLLTTET